jgi:plastocyanin
MRTKLLRLLFTLALFAIGNVAHASSIIWTNVAGGNWSVAANWSPNQTPVSADTAVITNAGNYTVTLDVSPTVAGLVVGTTSGSTTQTFLINGQQTFTLNGQATVNSNGKFNLTSGTLAGQSTLAGTLTWSGGNLTGVMTVSNSSVLNINGNNGVVLDGLTLTNNGTVNWTNATINSGAGCLIYNYGLWNEESDDIFYGENQGGPGTVFNNIGTFRKSGNTGTTTLDASVTLNNIGLVNVQSGTVALNGTYSLTNGTLNFGISNPTNFGQISLSGSPAMLSGTLSANLNSGYIPTSTNSFAVLSYGSETGTFTSTNLPFADAWQVNYGSTTATLQVLNARPILTVATNQTLNELTLLTVTNSATDIDTPVQTLTFALVSAPNGMSINPSSGVITWTPAQTQSPSTNTILVSVTDNGTPPLSATNSFMVIVKEVNVAPALPTVSTQVVNELTLLTVTNTATNSNIHSTITGYALVSPPAGMVISAGGVITWTPAQSQSHSTNTITTIVTNSNPYDLVNPQLTATNIFMVVVKEVNTAPTLPSIASTNVNELSLLMVTNTATNGNINSTITGYSLVSPPVGMSISASGVITWTPAQSQSHSTNTITTIVTNSNPYDLVNPQLTATNIFMVVVKEVNTAPVLPGIASTNVNELSLLTVTNTATNFNINSTITGYALVSPPAGMSISASGVITWTPAQSQSHSTNSITTIVTNSNPYDLVNPQLTATNIFMVVVKEVNTAPVLPGIASTNVNELSLLTVTNTATNGNIHSTITGYALVSPPAGMVISASGVITWTPTQSQSHSTNTITTIVTNSNPYDLVNSQLTATNIFMVVVNEQNTAPVLPGIATTDVNELSLLTVTNTATNFNINSTITGYALVSPPVGMSISASGVITWTPAQSQSHSTNSITTIVTNSNPYDLVNPRLTATNIFMVVVNEQNIAPVLPAIALTNVNELALLTVTNTAGETDVNATLAYTLVNPPVGMSISASGVITWTPAQSQSPGTYSITTVVTNTDAFDTVNPHLSATNLFMVIVYAPTLAPIGNYTVNVGQTVTFTAAATDNDTTRTLTFSLGSAPAGAGINSSSGVFNWQPVSGNAGTSNNVQVIVTDNSTPTLSATQTFAIVVNPLASAPPVLSIALTKLAGQVTTNATGAFVLSSSPGVGINPISVAAFTNVDGSVDLVCANANDNTLTLLTNNGSGVFGSNATINVLSYPSAVAAVDVNGDGKVDLIYASINAWTLTVLTNNGSGGFGSNATYNVGSYPTQVITADVNNDGKPDLICANFGASGSESSLMILTNNGSGGFAPDTTINLNPSGVEAQSVTAADVNKDGWVDLICVDTGLNSSPGNTLLVFTNNGSGGFSLSSSPVVGSGPCSVTAADVNNDGWPDLICANTGSGIGNTLTVLTNNRSGGFALSATLVVGMGVRSVIATDLNNDGWVDLVCANQNDETLTVLTNNHSGIFMTAATYGLGYQPSSVTAADVNRDGGVDLISANGGGNTVSVLTNSLSVHFGTVNSVVLSWPSPSTGYELQQNANLATMNWTNSSFLISDNGTTKSATNSAAGSLFFRLSHP